MAVRTVNIYTRSSLGAYLEGVLIRVMTTASVLVTEGTSDANGKVGPLLIEDGSYLVAAYKEGCLFPTGHSLVISEDHDYEIAGIVLALPTATSPKRCRIYGTLADPSGAIYSRTSVVFTPIAPKIAVGAQVIGGARTVRVQNGVVDVELYRGMYYRVSLPWAFPESPWKGMGVSVTEKEVFTGRILYVPDQSSLSLSAFLFPTPAWLKTTISNINVPVGGSVEVGASMLFTNGQEVDDLQGSLLAYSSVNGRVSVSLGTGKLILTGVSTGTDELVIERKEIEGLHIYDQVAITTGPLAITVVP